MRITVLFSCIIFFAVMSVTDISAREVRAPAVAGQFYPADADTLRSWIEMFLGNAREYKPPGEIMGIISPHAGYVYSAQAAAAGYKALTGKTFDAVIIIGTNHYDRYRGVSIYPGDAYATPLGEVPVDKNLAHAIADGSGFIEFSESGHGPREHSIEVQLPFLQAVLQKTAIVPMNIGYPDFNTCANLAKRIFDACTGKRVLLVASTDLSHYHPYDEAVEMDAALIRGLKAYDYMLVYQKIVGGEWEACGFGGITAVMMAAQMAGADEVMPVLYRTSGDVPGMDKDKVVGYLSALIMKNPEKKGGAAESDKKILFTLARTSIEEAVREEKGLRSPEAMSDFLKTPKGAFVTISRQGNLRGCIGYTFAHKPLYETIIDVAASAAVRDPRFPPMSAEELKDIEISISLLSPLRRIFDTNMIEIGKHGILLSEGDRQGLLLPQVAEENGWDRETFLRQTCRKAGLPENAYASAETEIYIFSAEVLYEK